MLKCARCKELKEDEEFSIARREVRRNGRFGYCKPCDAARRLERNNAEYQRDKQLQRKFNIDLVEYRRMLEAQDEKCAICAGICTSGRQLAVDHDHQTGKVRALLCMECNTGLGKFKDNLELLERAVLYMERYV